jgi:hypothetical protein
LSFPTTADSTSTSSRSSTPPTRFVDQERLRDGSRGINKPGRRASMPLRHPSNSSARFARRLASASRYSAPRSRRWKFFRVTGEANPNGFQLPSVLCCLPFVDRVPTLSYAAVVPKRNRESGVDETTFRHTDSSRRIGRAGGLVPLFPKAGTPLLYSRDEVCSPWTIPPDLQKKPTPGGGPGSDEIPTGLYSAATSRSASTATSVS